MSASFIFQITQTDTLNKKYRKDVKLKFFIKYDFPKDDY